MKYALDTNFIIDVLNKENYAVEQFNNTAKSNMPMLIPSIVDYEILRGFYHTQNTGKEAVYKNMRLNCPVTEVNAEIWNCAASTWAKLRKIGRTVGDADILIAAFCIINDCTLVTRNIKDFENMEDLQFVNWAE